MSLPSPTRGQPRSAPEQPGRSSPSLIGVGIDGTPGSRDAVVLSTLIARATGAELMLIAVHEEPLINVILPSEVGWTSTREQALATAVATRDSLAPEARIRVHSDALAWRGLRNVVRREHRDLLVVGSAQRAADGHVKLGATSDQLLGHLECPLAIAPRNMRERRHPRLDRIGVGFDGGTGAQRALELAGSLARSTSAELAVCAVADEQVIARLAGDEDWFHVQDIMAGEVHLLAKQARGAVRATGMSATVKTDVGVPKDRLAAFAADVDLLVIGSAGIGAAGRVYLGNTGSAVVDGAACPVLVVPRPEPAR